MDDAHLDDRPAEDRELARLWGSAAEPADPPDEAEILVQVSRRARRLDRRLLVRDAVETAAGLLVAVAMGRASWLAPGWLPKVGAAAVVAAVVYVVYRLLAARRRGAGAAAAGRPLTDHLRREIAKVQAQIDLLRTVRTWYVLPLAAGATLWLATLVPAVGLPPGATAVALLLAVAVSAVVFGIVGWVVVRLNRRAVEADLLPYRRELEVLLAEAEAEPAG
jgi:hypothetical protein